MNGSLTQVNNRQAFPPLVPISEYTIEQTTDLSSLRAPKTDCIQDQQISLLLSYSQSTRVQVTKTDKQASSETPQNILRDRLHKTLPLASSIPL